MSWALLALSLATCVASGCSPKSSVLRPNLVLITADGVRADALTCYGSTSAIGAEVCALGDAGARYEWAFTAATTGAPSAVSLLTSTYPSQHRVSDDPSTFLPFAGPPTLPDVLRRGGYATAAFVASPELNRSRHLDRGFDHYEDRPAGDDPEGAGSVGQRARDWTSTAPEPWFVWVHFAEPHGPFATDDPAAYRVAYGEAVRRLDRQLSQLIAVLDSETAPPGILLTALHGQSLGDVDGILGHGHFVEPAQVRVPLLWRSPRAGGGTGVGRRITSPVSLLDVAPTLLESAGLPPPSSFEGMILPHSDPDALETDGRVIFSDAADAVAVIRGRDFVLLPRSSVSAVDLSSPAPPRERWLRLSDPVERGGSPSASTAGSGPSTQPELRSEVVRLPLEWRRESEPDPTL